MRWPPHSADLYCYFFEQALRLLRNGSAGGRIGFISSSSFFKTDSGQKLREYLLANAQIEVVVDFGDAQIFEGVTTYPAIVIARRRGTPDAGQSLRFLSLKRSAPEDFGKLFKTSADTLPQHRLGLGPWQFEGDAMAQLRAKLSDGHPRLKEVYGAPCYGIKTGLNDAFVVTRAQRDALIARDPRSTELLKPFLEGKDLKKWRIESRDRWLIYIPKDRISIDDYPAIRAHLAPYKLPLEQRATQQEWFELQQAQQAYAGAMGRPKLVYTRFMDSAMFCLDAAGGYYLNNALNFIAGAGAFEAGLLNSRAMWFAIKELASVMSGGYVQVHGHVLERCPVPAADEADKARIAGLALEAQAAAHERRNEVNRFGHMVLRDLAPGGLGGGARLAVAWEQTVPDFAGFTAGLAKRFKRSLSLGERNDWESALNRARERVAAHGATIARCEQQIDAIVYSLFGLSEAEVRLIEAV